MLPVVSEAKIIRFSSLSKWAEEEKRRKSFVSSSSRDLAINFASFSLSFSWKIQENLWALPFAAVGFRNHLLLRKLLLGLRNWMSSQVQWKISFNVASKVKNFRRKIFQWKTRKARESNNFVGISFEVAAGGCYRRTISESAASLFDGFGYEFIFLGFEFFVFYFGRLELAFIFSAFLPRHHLGSGLTQARMLSLYDLRKSTEIRVSSSIGVKNVNERRRKKDFLCGRNRRRQVVNGSREILPPAKGFRNVKVWIDFHPSWRVCWANKFAFISK